MVTWDLIGNNLMTESVEIEMQERTREGAWVVRWGDNVSVIRETDDGKVWGRIGWSREIVLPRAIYLWEGHIPRHLLSGLETFPIRTYWVWVYFSPAFYFLRTRQLTQYFTQVYYVPSLHATPHFISRVFIFRDFDWQSIQTEAQIFWKR